MNPMHELPVTQSILDLALQHAGGRRVTDIHLVIGELSKFVDDSIQFYWEIIARDTPAQGAQLHFRRVSAQFQCTACLETYPPDGHEFSCPHCGSARVRIIAGEEFSLEAIDVE